MPWKVLNLFSDDYKPVAVALAVCVRCCRRSSPARSLRSRCGPLRRPPVLILQPHPGRAPHVGHPTMSISWGVSSLVFMEQTIQDTNNDGTWPGVDTRLKLTNSQSSHTSSAAFPDPTMCPCIHTAHALRPGVKPFRVECYQAMVFQFKPVALHTRTDPGLPLPFATLMRS
jgi:hypothetical protein